LDALACRNHPRTINYVLDADIARPATSLISLHTFHRHAWAVDSSSNKSVGGRGEINDKNSTPLCLSALMPRPRFDIRAKPAVKFAMRT
jgi:hypothetical protein